MAVRLILQKQNLNPDRHLIISLVIRITSYNVCYTKLLRTVLTEDQQRQFDFSFYEAAREKMMGNYERSATHLARCLTIDPTSGAAMFELANIFIAGNEPVKAQGILERAVELNGDNIWYKLLLADMYQNNKMPVKAITLYEQFVKDYPTNEDYRS